jgi:putative membrane protein
MHRGRCSGDRARMMSRVWDIALATLAAAYVFGWRRTALHPSSAARLGAFLTGVVALWAAVASPIARLDRGHLTGHMVQHLLLMTLAAPLLLWGEPVRVFRQGFRQAFRSRRTPGAQDNPPRWRSPNPVLCWFVGTFIVLVWHVPALFAFGMRWHGLQHATFLVAGLLFWLPVIRPWPTVGHWPSWSIPLYLFLATLPCDALSAFLVFCGRVVYPQYGALHAACGMGVSALEDQQRAGALMWFWVTFAYLVPAVVVTMGLLSVSKVPTTPLASSAPDERRRKLVTVA